MIVSDRKLKNNVYNKCLSKLACIFFQVYGRFNHVFEILFFLSEKTIFMMNIEYLKKFLEKNPIKGKILIVSPVGLGP